MYRNLYLFLTILVCVVVASGAARAQAPADWGAARIYERACAACHGNEGQGLDPDAELYRNFSSPPANLDDPLFNSREPASDWFLVVKYGGRRVGLSSQMPAFDGALSDEQIHDVVDHLKTLADTSGYPPGDLNFIRPISVTKAFPEDEALIINRYERRKKGDNPFLTTLYFAKRFGRRFHGEVKATHIKQGERSEFEEIEFDFKAPLSWNLEQGRIHALGLELAVPVGDNDEPEVFKPYYSFGAALSDRFTFQSELSSKMPVNDVSTGSAKFEGIFQYQPSPWGRSVTPGLEFTVTQPYEGQKSTEVTVLPQFYFGLSKLGHIAFTAGVEIPLTDEDYDYKIHAFLLWDIGDGPISTGW